MRVLGIVGPPAAGRSALVARVVERLDGRVGTVARGRDLDDSSGRTGAATDGAPAATTTFSVDGVEWSASGAGMDLDDVLERLARDHDYAIVEGFDDAAIPQVALGGYGHDGTTVAEAATADDVDVDAVCDALADVEPFETLESLVAEVERSPRSDRAGAIATFTGRVRERDGRDDPPTEYLEFEKYDGVADERMARIEAELRDRDGVYDVRLHHRTGVVEAGDDIVFVVVLAGHRREAFRTVEDGIDRLKEEVPLFKKEVTDEDSFWVHERE